MGQAINVHPFDQAINLKAEASGLFSGHTTDDYANMIGPFGGVSAAQALQAVWLNPNRLGEPISCTVNYLAPIAKGAFLIRAKAVRTNRSTQHWWVEMLQADKSVFSATVVTAVRRETWGNIEFKMPEVPDPEDCKSEVIDFPVAWVNRYDMRPADSNSISISDPKGKDSNNLFWVKDVPSRTLDFPSLIALCDVFLPRIYRRKVQRVAVGTISMMVNFHISRIELEDLGPTYLLAQARGQVFVNGFFDQVAQLWTRSGKLIATSQQLVYYKE